MAAWESAAQARIEGRETGRGNDIRRGDIGWGYIG
jgi:hypothetical protein